MVDCDRFIEFCIENFASERVHRGQKLRKFVMSKNLF